MHARSLVALTTLMALALTTAPASAEEQTYVDRRLAKMEEKLDLTDEQSDQIRQILDSSASQIAADRRQLEGNPEALQDAVKKTLDDANRQIEEILTDEQREEYVEFRKTARADLRTMDLQERLDLSEAQTSEVYEILLESEREIVKMRDEMRDSGGKGRRGGGMSKMRDIMEDTDKKIEKILTDEQKALYREITDERRAQMRERMGGRGGRGGFGRP